MSFFGAKNVGLEISLNNVPGYGNVNKFGQANDVDSGVISDVWDGSFGAAGVRVFIPPTAPRIHTLVSASLLDSDVGGTNPQSTGLRTVRVWYLPDWDTEETFEDVVMDGTAGVAMSNAAAIINRMEGLTWGSGGLNAGIITATAAVDATVSALILTGNNQTQMVIYGVPTGFKLRVEGMGCAVVDSAVGGTKRFAGHFFEMIDPVVNVVNNTAFIIKEHFDVVEGLPSWTHDYDDVPKQFDGPCIVKMQGTSDTNNTVVTGYFDAFIVQNTN